MTALDRLEDWKFKHKARSCDIRIADGYGSTCWTVTIRGERLPGDTTPIGECGRSRHRTRIDAAECSFWGLPSCESTQAEWEAKLPPTTVFASPPWDEEAESFPGLAAVIDAAIDRWEKLSAPPAAASDTAEPIGST